MFVGEGFQFSHKWQAYVGRTFRSSVNRNENLQIFPFLYYFFHHEGLLLLRYGFFINKILL